MQKILVTLQGNTLILPYEVKSGLLRNGSGWAAYIRIPPAQDLTRFDLRGLTPDMFCINIADSVNVRGQLSGVVENEQQLPVAQWTIDAADYRQAISACRLNHAQMLALLISLPGYVSEDNDEFIEFEGMLAPRNGVACASGYRLTVVTQDIGDRTAPYASYNLDTYSGGEWRSIAPPATDHAALHALLKAHIEAIIHAGVPITQQYDSTDYE